MNPGSELDCDWTLDANRGKEFALRELRNDLIKRQLEKGLTMAYRSSATTSATGRFFEANDHCYYNLTGIITSRTGMV